MTSTSANATNDIIIEFTDQRFCITPPYRTISPGTLMRPTNVAAVNCHEVLPVSGTLPTNSFVPFVICGQAPGCTWPTAFR